MFVTVQEIYIVITHQKAQLVFILQFVKNNIQRLIKTIYICVWWSVNDPNHNIAILLNTCLSIFMNIDSNISSIEYKSFFIL